MRRPSVLAALVVVALVVLVPVSAQGANGHANYRAVCPGPPAGYAHCHALVVTDSRGNPRAQSAPYGLSPTTIKSVYGFDSSNGAGAGTTIAIVDAYDDPSAESDLNVFSSQYGLPACTTANGCFKKVNQTGGSSYPRTDSGWALEISLDVQWAHAIAPSAKILLVEARSSSLSNLLTAESYATGHAGYVSNSWGASEFSSESAYDSYFNGASVFVSSGDSGLPAEWPSSASNVISVGGTTLHFSGTTFTNETGWSDGGGGCSAYETATSAQHPTSQSLCGTSRATPDVSLDADPASGVSVYDSTPYSGQSGWWKVGGTSASSPMWAARSADQGVAVNAAYVYGNNITFRDITSGNNGASCLVGFDLCSGRGSWTGGGSAQAPDFGISATPGSRTVTAGTGTSYDVTVTPNGSFSGSVGLSLSGSPSGVTGTFNPASTTGSSTIDISTASNTTPGTYTLTITGSGDGVTHSTTVSLTVTSAGTSAMAVTVDLGTVSMKGPNYHVPLTVTAASGSTPISGAAVSLQVYSGSYSNFSCSGTLAATGTGTTGSTGQVSFDFRTRSTGSWCALATVSATGYDTASGATGFST
jgi:subtilase family serine protease